MADIRNRLIYTVIAIAGAVYGLVLPVQAGEADVMDVEVVKMDDGRYRFAVTVLHDDSGWEHYANKWEVLDPDGNILATRILVHPHENEQPFKRSLGGIEILASVTSVRIRAHDLVHGYGGREMTVDLPD